MGASNNLKPAHVVKRPHFLTIVGRQKQMKDEIFRAEIYSLLDDMDKALSAALSAPLLAKQKPLEQLAKLQRRFNQKMAKAVCYG